MLRLLLLLLLLPVVARSETPAAVVEGRMTIETSAGQGTIPVAVSIMVFFALCAQCASTLMVIRRETNSWGWSLFTFVYMTTLAYLAALIVYQAGTAIGG